jgi:transcriptional regulator with XRE-family HTH domain
MTDVSASQIALKLRETREMLGLSQSEVAEKLDRTQSYVSRCETETRRLDIFELEAFASLFTTVAAQQHASVYSG